MQHPQFPRLEARDLTGATRWLPDTFEGNRNVVFVAFRREQQDAIDTWCSWLDVVAPMGIVPYEVPVLARRWRPLRSMIDGGMAGAISDLATRRRTLTVYGDVRRVTGPLGITDRSSVWVFMVTRDGAVLEVVTGGYDAASAERLMVAAGGGGA